MKKSILYLITAWIFLFSWTPAFAHIALDPLKQVLDSRIKNINSSKTLSEEQKTTALEHLQTLQSKLTSAATLSAIPSQQKAAQDLCQQLSHELEGFDKTLNTFESNLTDTSE